MGGPNDVLTEINITTQNLNKTINFNANFNFSIFITAPSKKEILTQGLIKNNSYGTYNCNFITPYKKNNYEIHILIDKKALSESPYLAFFNNDTSISIQSIFDAHLTKIKNKELSDQEKIQDTTL